MTNFNVNLHRTDRKKINEHVIALSSYLSEYLLEREHNVLIELYVEMNTNYYADCVISIQSSIWDRRRWFVNIYSDEQSCGFRVRAYTRCGKYSHDYPISNKILNSDKWLEIVENQVSEMENMEL